MKKDCTPLERTEMKRLMEERNKKREETKTTGGNENWIIRQGKVVNVTRKHEEKQKGVSGNCIDGGRGGSR